MDQLALGGGLILQLNEDGVVLREVELAGTYRVQADTLVRFTRASDQGLPAWQLHYNAQTGVLADSVRGRGPFVLVLAPRLEATPAR